MRLLPLAIVTGLLTISPMAAAQTNHHQPMAHGTAASPYAGFQTRALKALSDQQVADLRAGRGMGLALPAELNGYPGPVHVLELAAQLELSDEVASRTKALLQAMKVETIAIGEKIIAEETTLDRLFADRRITAQSLEASVKAIGAAQDALRIAHLRYHLTMRDMLSPEQIARYDELRGYHRK